MNQPSSAPVTPQRTVILVVDNDPLMLTGVAAVLHMRGYECHCARDRAAALKASAQQPLDLVVCDIELGRDNGFDVYQAIERMHPGLPAVFASSGQLPDVVRKSHASGGVYCLRKPFDPDLLIELVEQALWMPHLVRSHLEQQGAIEALPAEMSPVETPVLPPPSVPAPAATKAQRRQRSHTKR